MKISFFSKELKINIQENQKKHPSIKQQRTEQTKPAMAKLKTSVLAAFFLLPASGTINAKNTVSNETTKTEFSLPVNDKTQYIKKGQRTFYTIKKGDTPQNIAKKFNVSTRRLLFANGLTNESKIYPDKKLIIPESYTVKNIKTIYDAAKVSGLSKKFLEELANFEEVKNTIYTDRNKNKTIGIGHLITDDELKLYQGKKLTAAQIHTIFAQDLLNIELDLKTIINEKEYEKLPIAVKESVMDLAFNKGVGSIANNPILLNALNKGDLATSIAHINQDYSLVKNAKGKLVKKPASGLSKRRLYDMANASRIFKKGIPPEILQSAKIVYARGLKYLEAEKNRGEISKEAYPNVLAEYKDLAYKWYNGKIGEKAVTARANPKPNPK